MSETDKVRDERFWEPKPEYMDRAYSISLSDLPHRQKYLAQIMQNLDAADDGNATLRQQLTAAQNDNTDLRARFNQQVLGLANVKQALALYCDVWDGGEVARKVLGIEQEGTDEV
jgi:hypothetical protein